MYLIKYLNQTKHWVIVDLQATPPKLWDLF